MLGLGGWFRVKYIHKAFRSPVEVSLQLCGGAPFRGVVGEIEIEIDLTGGLGRMGGVCPGD